MKVLSVFVVIIGSYTVCPIVPGFLSHKDDKHRHIWMPDCEGVLHRINVVRRPKAHLRELNEFSIAYWLYTKRNPVNPQLLVKGNLTSIRVSNYQNSKPLNVIIHGWLGFRDCSVNSMLRDAFMEACDCNFIVVDWMDVARIPYLGAKNAAPFIGPFIYNFLTWLINSSGGSWSNVHLIGYSMGAHIAGLAGRAAGGRAGRITGLDPAGPMWNKNPNALKETDGVYVEVIHTNSDFGIMKPIGRTNFYPNAHLPQQPGCWVSTCSHNRAYELFAATVKYNHLVGRKCIDRDQATKENACVGAHLKMGNINPNKQGRGIYALSTTESFPFSNTNE